MNETLRKADLLFEQRNYEKALELYREYLASESEDAEAYCQAARCLLQLKEYEKASEYAGAATSVSPEFHYGYYIQAYIFLSRNLDNEARDCLETALELSPTSPDYHVLMANLHSKKGNWQAASDSTDIALGFDPTHSAALVEKARAMTNLRMFPQARATLESVLEDNPESESALVELGHLSLHERNWREAFVTFEKALIMNPESEAAKEGFMLALRARYPFYGLVLGYSLWLNRFSKKHQQSIQYGLSVMVKLMGVIRKQYPALAPILGFILAVWKIFAYMTWTVRAGTTLLLRGNEFGRRLVTKDEVLESNIVGGLWLMALLCWLYHLYDPFTWFCRVGMIIFLSLPLLVAGAFGAPSHGWPKYVSRTIAGVMGVIGIAALFLITFGHPRGFDALQIYAYGFTIAILILPYLESVEPEKK